MLCIRRGSRSRDEPDEVRRQPVFRQNGDEMLRVFKDAPQVISRTLGLPSAAIYGWRDSSPFPHFDVPTDTRSTVISSTSRGKDLPGGWKTCGRGGARSAQAFAGRVRTEIGPRTCHYPADEVLGVFPDCVGFHPLCAGTGHSGGPGADRRRGRWWHIRWGLRTSIRCSMKLLFERFLNPSASPCRILTSISA